jgi:hypothetical protein
MNGSRINLLLAGVVAWIGALPMVTTTYASSIIMGGDHTAIGTIVLVSPNPGDSAQNNGTALLNTLAGITADANNPYVIKIGPGVYDIGANILLMKSYVDLEGSGENVTTISGNNGNIFGVLHAADHAELRFLTVENRGTGTHAVALFTDAGGSPKITHVTANSTNGSHTWAVYIYQTNPILTNLTAYASGGTDTLGIHNHNASPIISNSRIKATGGVGGAAKGVYNYNGSPYISNSGISANSALGDNNYGVYNQESTPTIVNTVISASGANVYNVAVWNDQGAYPGMSNISGTASGGIYAIGLYNANADGGGAGLAYCDRCDFSASGGSSFSQAVRNDCPSPNNINLSATGLNGGVGGSGQIYCVFCFNSQTYQPLGSDCH